MLALGLIMLYNSLGYQALSIVWRAACQHYGCLALSEKFYEPLFSIAPQEEKQREKPEITRLDKH